MRRITFRRMTWKNAVKTEALVLLVLVFQATAQTGGPYQLSWTTIDGGGGRSSGGPYVVTGTIGQPDADWSRGGDYELLGGFWPGGPLCTVNFEDFALFAQLWLLSDPIADLNGDDELNFNDLSWLTAYWLRSCPLDWPLR